MPPQTIRVKLRQAGLRPTRQRVSLAGEIFRNETRHLSAEVLHRQIMQSGETISLATIYNTLNCFVHAGLLRRVPNEGERFIFDTRIGNHHHFYIGAEDRIIDVPPDAVCFQKQPKPPDGYEIESVTVVFNLKQK